jgi:hypothetical protein
MSTPDIAAAMASAMSAENRRRELAGRSPGLGAPLPLPDLPYHSHGLGPAVGEGYDVTAEIAGAVHKAYGPDRPVYGDPAVAGRGYRPAADVPVRRHVTNLGADGLLIDPGPDGRQSGDPFTVVSPAAATPSLWRGWRAGCAVAETSPGPLACW